jgi:hypothetical protein
MSVRVDLQGIPEGYFIDRESALGVTTGWRTLLEYQAAGFSLPNARGFIEQCLWIPELRIFCGFCAKGHLFSRVRLKQSSRMRLRRIRLAVANTRESSQYKHGNSLFIAEDQTSLVQSNQKACLAQTRDE